MNEEELRDSFLDDTDLAELERRAQESGNTLGSAELTSAFEHVATHWDDVAIVSKAKEGDEDAFTNLFKRYYAFTYAITYHHARDATEAEGAAMAAWEKVAKGLHGFDTDRGFKPWLRRVTVRTCIDQFRQAATRRRTAAQLQSQLHQLGMENNSFPEFYDAWESITQEQRRLLWLRFFAGYSRADIAQDQEHSNLWGTTPQSVGNHERAAMKAFAERLKQLGFTEVEAVEESEIVG